MNTLELLEHARTLARQADDEAAKMAYVGVLRVEPTHFAALNELGTLALAGGFRSAARTAYQQAVLHHPDNAVGHVNLANVLREEGDLDGAKAHYTAALLVDENLHEAHQGMAWVLNERGESGAEQHWRRGFEGHALVSKPYRGTGIGVPLLLLVSARGGNVPTQLWIDDRRFAVNALFAEFYDPALPLPPHAFVMNAIGDADLCPLALDRAQDIAVRSGAPLINRPERVRVTGRADNARRLASIPGVIAPKIEVNSAAQLLAAPDVQFPLLLRRPGFHTGQHFVRVASRDELHDAATALGPAPLLAIEYLDARGADGLSRKYRVMYVDGTLYPLHLAVSRDWKVHYFTSDMADEASHRAEEKAFLDDMPAVLGERAMRALHLLFIELGLDYAGIDFAVNAEGEVLLFEANATMVVYPPGPDPRWDYRRAAINAVLSASTQMLLDRTDSRER